MPKAGGQLRSTCVEPNNFFHFVSGGRLAALHERVCGDRARRQGCACTQDPSTGVAEVSFPKKIKGTRDFKFLDDDLQARTSRQPVV